MEHQKTNSQQKCVNSGSLFVCQGIICEGDAKEFHIKTEKFDDVIAKSEELPFSDVGGNFKSEFASHSTDDGNTCEIVGNYIEGNELEVFKCSFCSFSAKTSIDMSNHVQTHTGERPYKCLRCSYAASTKRVLENHISSHFNGNTIKCELPSRTSWKNLCAGKISDDKLFACKVCSYSTLTKCGLRKHEVIHNRNDSLQCNNCIYKASGVDDLKDHMKTHNKIKKISCTHCDYKSPYKRNVSRHIKKHHKEIKPDFKCDLCSYTARDSHNLKIHKEIHLKDKPYQCTSCPYKKLRKFGFQQHTKNPTDNKPYKCTICPFAASVGRTFKNHVKYHSYDNPFKCQKCVFSAIKPSALIKHSEVHEKNYMQTNIGS